MPSPVAKSQWLPLTFLCLFSFGVGCLVGYRYGWIGAQYHYGYSLVPWTSPTPSAALPSPSPDPYAALTYDNCLISINNKRVMSGVPQLADERGDTDQRLVQYAQRHAEDIASGKTSGHQEFTDWSREGIFSGFGQLGELITTGEPSCSGSATGLMGDPSHIQALTDPAEKSVAIGISGEVEVYILRQY